jgi:hypothetical protein
MARSDKSYARTSPGVTAPARGSRPTPTLLVAVTIAIALGGSVFWYRTGSRAVARDVSANPNQNSSLTLDPAAFAGQTRDAYQIARDEPALLVQLHCYCGCDKVLGHRNLLDCFRDKHAASCATCMGEAIDGNQMATHGSPVEQIHDALRTRYEHAE